MTFVWKFTGVVDTVSWGSANDAGDDVDKQMVSLDSRGVNILPLNSVPEAYRGRVNGTRTGDSSAGQANFTIYNVTNDDEKFYVCLLKPDDPNQLQQIPNFVHLVVVGMYLSISL